MTPEVLYELSLHRTAELQRDAAMHRLARAAASRPSARSPRERLGRRLVSLGAWMAGDKQLADGLCADC